MQTKRIVVLANSRKHAGRCVAGREIVGDGYAGWVRPVSARPGEEIDDRDSNYRDGQALHVLDVVDVPLLRPKPHAGQSENWLISDDDYWIKVGTANWDQARALAESPPTLWRNGVSTYAGNNDELSAAEHAKDGKPSIYLIHVKSVEIHILDPGKAFGNPKRRVQARFNFNGYDYWIWVTDQSITSLYLAGKADVTKLGECLVTVSLAEPYEKKGGERCHYKLAAAIIQR